MNRTQTFSPDIFSNSLHLPDQLRITSIQTTGPATLFRPFAAFFHWGKAFIMERHAENFESVKERCVARKGWSLTLTTWHKFRGKQTSLGNWASFIKTGLWAASQRYSEQISLLIHNAIPLMLAALINADIHHPECQSRWMLCGLEIKYFLHYIHSEKFWLCSRFSELLCFPFRQLHTKNIHTSLEPVSKTADLYSELMSRTAGVVSMVASSSRTWPRMVFNHTVITLIWGLGVI